MNCNLLICLVLIVGLSVLEGCYKWKYKCSNQSDCKDGEFCSSGLCVSLKASNVCEGAEKCPAAPVFDPVSPSSSKEVTLGGKAEPNLLVTVYEGDSAISNAKVNADGLWTALVSLEEGSHSLTAKTTNDLGLSSPLSEPVAVNVDLTSPTVAGRIPAPESKNVCSRAPITVSFSEPMNPRTVTDSAIVVSSGKIETIDKTLSLSEDGKSLVIRPTTKLIFPDDLVVEISNKLSDLAGNQLVLPEDKWKWSVPEWVDLGIADTSYSVGSFGYSEYSSIWSKVLAVGPACEVALGCRHVKDSKSTIFFHRWNGISWSQIGGSTGDVATSMSVDVDSTNQPVFAWSEMLSGEGASSVFVARWNGSKEILETIGGNIDDGTKGSGSPNIKLDSSGNPVLAWREYSSNKIFVKRWNGSEWRTLGTAALNDDSSVTVRTPIITIHDENLIRVSWSEHSGIKTRTWDGNKWHGYGWSVSSIFSLDEFSISQNSIPYTLSFTNSPEKNSMKLWKMDGVSWSELKQFAIEIDPETNSDAPHLGILPDNKPIVTWQAFGENGSEIYIRYSDPRSTQSTVMNVKLSSDEQTFMRPMQPIVATDPSGIFAIAFITKTQASKGQEIDSVVVKLFNNTIF